MKSTLKCSFVIPGYKCDDVIDRNLASLLDQDYKNWEAIVVLNGIWETKEALASTLREKYHGDQIRIMSIPEPGLGNANNVGFRASTGDIISHLSSDLYLMPGALRTWVEAFEDHPDCDIVYSGYKFVSQDPSDIYYSQSFDRYHLECENIIDGANPYRRKIFKPWSVSLKSLFDWDFMLSLTDHGSKAFYIHEPLYFAEPPKPGGLSEDSNRFWVKRRREIQALHHIPDRKICVASPDHWKRALEIAKMCEFDFRMYPGHKPHEYNLIYSYGFPVGENKIQRSTGIFFQHYGHKVIHWTESDVNSLLNWEMKNVIYYTDMVLKRMKNNFCMTQKQQRDLIKLGLEPEIVYPPVFKDDMTEKLTDTISVNDHGILDQLVKAMPDITFKLNDPKCGMSIHFQDDVTNVLKSIISGNHVITDDYLQGTYRIEGFTNVPELRKMLVHTIRRLRRLNIPPDEKTIKEFTDKTRVSFFRNKLERIAEKKVEKYGKLIDLEARA